MHLFESFVLSLIFLKSKALNSFSDISAMSVVWGSLFRGAGWLGMGYTGGWIIFFVLFYASIRVGLSLSFDFLFFQVYLDVLSSVTLSRGISIWDLLLTVGWSCWGNFILAVCQQDQGYGCITKPQNNQMESNLGHPLNSVNPLDIKHQTHWNLCTLWRLTLEPQDWSNF